MRSFEDQKEEKSTIAAGSGVQPDSDPIPFFVSGSSTSSWGCGNDGDEEDGRACGISEEIFFPRSLPSAPL